MKVPASVRDEYARRLELCELLKTRVLDSMEPHIPETWHLESRVKKEVSFAQKLETGRFTLDEFDDMFGCTIVVPKLSLVEAAEATVRSLFEVRSRKPERDDVVPFSADSFIFDGVRLHVNLRPPIGLDARPVEQVNFEIQIRTYLQHAWSISTHDLTYKTSQLSWGRARVAAQVKAMLESAEVSILEVEALNHPGNQVLSRSDRKTDQLLRVSDTLRTHFSEDELPVDLKRLAETVRDVFASAGLDAALLDPILSAGREHYGGAHPSNLSPYSVVIQYLLDQEQSRIEKAMRKQKPRILLVRELHLPVGLEPEAFPNAIKVGF